MTKTEINNFRFRMLLLGLGLSIYILLILLSIYGSLSVNSIPFISTIYETIKGPTSIGIRTPIYKVLSAAAASLISGAAIITAIGLAITWVKEWIFQPSKPISPQNRLYTPAMMEGLYQNGLRVSDETQAIHEALFEGEKKTQGPKLWRRKNHEIEEYDDINVSDLLTTQIRPSVFNLYGKSVTSSSLKLGVGSFGRVKKHIGANGEVFAVKSVVFCNPQIETDFDNEVSVLTELGVCKASNKIQKANGVRKGYIATEFYEGKTLGQLILGDDYTFKTDETLSILREVMQQAQRVHQKGYLHNDIHMSNIIVDFKEGLKAKLIDFGASRAIGIPYPGDTYHLAPEIRLNPASRETIPRTPESEIFNLGCALYQVCIRTTGSHYDIISAATALIRQMQNPDPSQRPTLDTVLQRIAGWERQLHTQNDGCLSMGI